MPQFPNCGSYFMKPSSSRRSLPSPLQPDATVFSPEILDLLEELNQIKPVWIELGLQTIHEETLTFIRSGFTLHQYEKAVYALHERGISVITHLILGLPGETKDAMRASVSLCCISPGRRNQITIIACLKGNRSRHALSEGTVSPFHVRGILFFCGRMYLPFTARYGRSQADRGRSQKPSPCAFVEHR